MGDDTDLLVLLIYHTKLIHNEIFFIPEPKKNSKCRIWNVKQVKTELGSFVCKHILFLHAMLGCDTSSWLFGIQSKCWASKGSWGLWFNSLNIKPNWISWWKGAGGNVWRKKQWVIEFPPSLEILWKIGPQPSKCRPQRPSTHFSCWKVSQLQIFFSDMPMEKLWMWYVARVLGLDSIPPKLICHQHPMIYLKWSGVTAALTAAAPAVVAKNMDWSILWHVGSVMELHVSMQVHL